MRLFPGVGAAVLIAAAAASGDSGREYIEQACLLTRRNLFSLTEQHTRHTNTTGTYTPYNTLSLYLITLSSYMSQA